MQLHTFRKPFVFIGVALLAIVVILDFGSSATIAAFSGAGADVPGFSIFALGLLDGMLLLQASMLVWDALQLGRVGRWLNGPGMLVLSIVVIITGIVLVIATILLLMLMVSIFMALPFGPLIYAAIWGNFAKDAAMTILSITLVLRLLGVAGLILYNQSMLTKKKFMALILTCIVIDLVNSFLLGLVPGLLCSITDAIGAIIGAIVAIVWAVILLFAGIGGTIDLIKLEA